METGVDADASMGMSDVHDPFKVVDDLLARVQNIKNEMVSWTSALKIIRKQIKAGKRSRRQAPNSVTGFKTPKAISPELAQFLKVPPETMIARTEITRSIWKHINEHNLKDDIDKRLINLSKPGGESLQALLKPTEPLSLSNLQKHLKDHIRKNDEIVMMSDPVPPPEPLIVPEPLVVPEPTVPPPAQVPTQVPARKKATVKVSL